jgi:bile acid:Na+ symporter, BASS family
MASPYLIDILLSLVLAFIMMSVGLSLTIDNFRNLFLFPRTLIIGLASQIIVLPLIAFVISYFSGFSAEFKVGLIILASCPGGTTSGMLTYFFRGNVALSITFTAINSLITLFTIPLIVNLSLMYYFGESTLIHLSYIETIVQIFAVTIIPAGIGVLVRRYFPLFADRARKPLRYLLIAALGCVFVIYFFANKKEGGTGITYEEILGILPLALLLNALCMAWGYYLGLVTRLGRRNSYTIGIESSVHNTTLAFLVAGSLLQNQEMVKPALVYAIFSFWTAILYSYIIKKSKGIGIFEEFKS